MGTHGHGNRNELETIFSFFFKVGEVAPSPVSSIWVSLIYVCFYFVVQSSTWNERIVVIASKVKGALSCHSEHHQQSFTRHWIFFGAFKTCYASLVPPGFPRNLTQECNERKVRARTFRTQPSCCLCSISCMSRDRSGLHGMPWMWALWRLPSDPKNISYWHPFPRAQMVFPTRSEYLRNMTPKIRHPMIFHWLRSQCISKNPDSSYSWIFPSYIPIITSYSLIFPFPSHIISAL